MFKLLRFLSSKKEKVKKDKKISFSTAEKEEIKEVVRTLSRETSTILSKRLKELNCEKLSKEIELQDSIVSVTNNDDHFEENNNNFDTLRCNDLSSKDDTDDNQFDTFRPQVQEKRKRKRKTRNKTKRPKRSNSTDDTAVIQKNTFKETTGTSKSTSNLKSAFREPENWEKHILALETGEWPDAMIQNGAFKRWKKERPQMPFYFKAT